MLIFNAFSEKEKEEEKLREIQRRKDGQQILKMKDELELIQRQKIADEIKREKEADKAARDAILKKIEQDKAERKARLNPVAQTSPSTATPNLDNLIKTNSVSKDGKTKLAIRLLDGSQVVQEFDCKEVLSAVRAFIVTQKNIDYNITFAMPPRPPFTDEDMTKPLQALGLVPNARINVVKRSF